MDCQIIARSSWHHVCQAIDHFNSHEMSGVCVGLENHGEQASDMMMSGSVVNSAIRSEEILLGLRNFCLLARRECCKMRRGNFEDPCCSSTVKEEGGCEGCEFRFGALECTHQCRKVTW